MMSDARSIIMLLNVEYTTLTTDLHYVWRLGLLNLKNEKPNATFEHKAFNRRMLIRQVLGTLYQF